MDDKEIVNIPETLRAAANCIGVALRERAREKGLKTFEDLDDDDAAES